MRCPKISYSTEIPPVIRRGRLPGECRDLGISETYDLSPMITITVASSDQHLEEILALQRRYHARSVSEEVQSREGFVFAEHTLPLLRRMAAQSPQAIALFEGHVVGYCLTLPLTLRRELPALGPMFEEFGRCMYRGRPLSEHRFVVGGQVCVDRA